MKRVSVVLLFLLAIVSVGCKKDGKGDVAGLEDKQAKQLLQGVWTDEDGDNVVFRAEGDTIYYPDTLSQPAFFAFFKDTLLMRGESTTRYKVLRQTVNIFEFVNLSGEHIKLRRSYDEADSLQFVNAKSIVINQRKVIKRDSTVAFGAEKYHYYVQVNPTTYKVFKSSYNDEGIEVENVYYDNTVHLSVFKQGVRLFSKDFKKSDFAKKVEKNYLSSSILSDIRFIRCDAKGLLFDAEIAIPDSYTNYNIQFYIGFGGKVSIL